MKSRKSRIMLRTLVLFSFIFIILLVIFVLAQDVIYPTIDFVSPTPDDYTTQINTFAEINISIIELNLANFTYSWNRTNYTLYDDSLVLMLNFDNVSALGENDSKAVDETALSNVSLLLNGFYNSTNTSGTEGTYMFDFTFSPDNATYNWALEACDISSNCNVTNNRSIHTWYYMSEVWFNITDMNEKSVFSFSSIGRLLVSSYLGWTGDCGNVSVKSGIIIGCND